jgi:Zn-dependent protease
LLATLIPSIVIHELAHGGSAYLLGDRSSQRNPISLRSLIDPLGTIAAPSILVLGGIGWFGWARSIPVDATSLRGGRNGRLVVSLAGPVTSLGISALCVIVFGMIQTTHSPVTGYSLVANVIYCAGLANLSIGIINLVPVPPLDGSSILERFLPSRAWPRYLKVRQYLLPGLIGFVVADLMFHLTIVDRFNAWLISCWSGWIS